MGINGLSFSLLRVGLSATAQGEWLAWDAWLEILNQIAAGQTAVSPLSFTDFEQLGRWFFWGAIILFVVVIGFWLVMTWAEAGIITAVDDLAAGQPVTLSQAMRWGGRWLKTFVAIDAIVFFPWFVLALLIMLLVTAVLLGGAFVSLQQADLQSVLRIFGVGAICLLPLLCLLPLVSLASVYYRLLAFREAALRRVGARQAVRQTWRRLRQHLGTLLLLGLLVWGLQYLLNWGFSALSLPLYGLAAIPATMDLSLVGILALAASLAGALVVAFLKGVVYTFTAAVWTLAYRDLIHQEQ